MTECASCGDRFHAQLCQKCAGTKPPKVARNRRILCGLCHAELFHGAIPLVTDGKPGGVPTQKGHAIDEGEDSPWHENAVGDMEDGGP